MVCATTTTASRTAYCAKWMDGVADNFGSLLIVRKRFASVCIFNEWNSEQCFLISFVHWQCTFFKRSQEFCFQLPCEHRLLELGWTSISLQFIVCCCACALMTVLISLKFDEVISFYLTLLDSVSMDFFSFVSSTPLRNF